MRILLASAEFSPLARTGGLGDAVAGLTHALIRQGVDVTVIMPRYRHLMTRGEADGPVYRDVEGPVPLLLVDDAAAFDREGVYGPAPGEAYEDEWERWGRFCRVVAEVADEDGFDLLHLHDAHAAPVSLLADVRSVFTVHNAAYPVLGPLEAAIDLLGLPAAAAEPAGPLEWFGDANYMKAGLMGAARVTTVSPGFARQLALDPEVASGLDGVVRALPQAVAGIMNGIDVAHFDPAADLTLPKTYSPRDPSGRVAARPALADKTGIDDRGVIFGMVGRVSAQKGFDLIDETIDDLVADGMRLVILGAGELDKVVDGWLDRFPKAVFHGPFDESLARLTWAGADAYLMPSKFEPGGLGNLYAMRYGCPPVVRFTGGLADTVTDVDEVRDGNGFGFRSYLPAELAKTVRRAMRYRTSFPDLWKAMQMKGMSTDWSWDRAARQYIEVYRDTLAAF